MAGNKVQIGNCTLYNGDCLEVMKGLGKVDAVATDPPYHLTTGSRNGSPRTNNPDNPAGRTRLGEKGFMGQTWDGGDIAFQPATWALANNLLKPGGHIAAFSGSRTYHRMAVAIEDGGFECRDQVLWLYGSGFPKSHDVSKGIDRAAGAEREVVLVPTKRGNHAGQSGDIALGATGMRNIAPSATPEAQQWQGWGSALKPAHEPIFLGRKPFPGSIASNVLEHGTGALNIDGCRVESSDSLGGGAEKTVAVKGKHEGWERPWMHDDGAVAAHASRVRDNVARAESLGRWPANLIHDGSIEVVECFPPEHRPAVRFFYSPKVGKEERNYGCDELDTVGLEGRVGSPTRNGKELESKNTHPTVKPIDLMAWLCRLITPPGGTVLDPFMGSGSTGLACIREGFHFIGIEQSPEYFEIACKRIEKAVADKEAAPSLFDNDPVAAQGVQTNMFD